MGRERAVVAVSEEKDGLLGQYITTERDPSLYGFFVPRSSDFAVDVERLAAGVEPEIEAVVRTDGRAEGQRDAVADAAVVEIDRFAEAGGDRDARNPAERIYPSG